MYSTIWTFLLFSIFIILLYFLIFKKHILRAYYLFVPVYINGILQNIMSDTNIHWTQYRDCIRSGSIAIVTGGSSGIGIEVVKAFLNLNMTVIIGCRNVIKGQKAIQLLRETGETGGYAECYQLDTSSLNSVKNFAQNISKKYTHINILVNNAGIFYSPYIITEDGYENIFATNFLGHTLLTYYLLPILIKGAEIANYNSRIINVTSNAYEKGTINYNNINHTKIFYYLTAYAQSKFAMVLFSKALNEKLKLQNIPLQIHSVHPGVVGSNIFNNIPESSIMPRLFFMNVEEGSRSIVFASLNKLLENKGGNYIVNCIVKPTIPKSNNKNEQEKFWNFTLKCLDIEKFF